MFVFYVFFCFELGYYRQEALQLWRQKLSINATYGDLLRVCCNGNDMQTADVIFEVLQSKSD